MPKVDKLYPMQFTPVSSTGRVLVTIDELWHMRLGHMADRTLKQVCIPGHTHGSVKHCEACAKGKSKKNSFPRSDSESENILELLHVDLAGPFTNNIQGGKYFMVIVDDRSRYYEVYILKHRSEALGFIKRFTQLDETRTGKKVKRIRSDNGGEFLNDEWDQGINTKRIDGNSPVPTALLRTDEPKEPWESSKWAPRPCYNKPDLPESFGHPP